MGIQFQLECNFVLQALREVQGHSTASSRGKSKAEYPIDEADGSEIEQADYRARLLSLIKSLPPNGFERLCQRMLRESGFQQVVVTGRSGDGGIDGMGISGPV